jgi:hypothetical protein
VVRRAWEILAELEKNGAHHGRGIRRGKEAANGVGQVDMFGSAPSSVLVENPAHRKVFDAVMGLDLNGLSPLDVLF